MTCYQVRDCKLQQLEANLRYFVILIKIFLTSVKWVILSTSQRDKDSQSY